MRLGSFAIFLLLGCEREPVAAEPKQLPIPSGPPAPQQPPSRKAVEVRASQQWQAEVFAGGTALGLRDPDGKLVLSVACVGDPRRLMVRVPTFSAIGSEERLSFGLDDNPIVLVVEVSGQKNGQGVSGEADVPQNFVRELSEAQVASASYGAQAAGPFPAPGPELARALDEACRP